MKCLSQAVRCLPLLLLPFVGCDSPLVEQDNLANPGKLAAVVGDNSPADWPQWQGPTGDGTIPNSSLANVMDLQIRWELPVGLGYSSPVATDGKVVIFDRVGHEERVRGVQLQDGQLIWETRNPVSFQTQFPMYTNGPIPTPAIADHRVFAVGAEGRTQCLDLETGNILWATAPNSLMKQLDSDTDPKPVHQLPPFGTGGSPVVYQQSVLVSLPTPGGSHSLFCLNKSDGKVIWHAIEQRCSYATPVVATIHGRTLVLMLHDRGLSGVDWESGNLLFFYPFRATVVDSENAVCPIVHGNQIFISAYGMPGTLLEVNETFDCRRVWENIKSIDSQYSNIILRDGVLFGFSARTKRLHVASWQTGNSLGRWKLPMTRGMMVADQDRLLILGDTSSIAIVDVSDPENLEVQFESNLDLKSKIFCTPCLVGDCMVVRDEQRMVAYSLEDID